MWELKLVFELLLPPGAGAIGMYLLGVEPTMTRAARASTWLLKTEAALIDGVMAGEMAGLTRVVVPFSAVEKVMLWKTNPSRDTPPEQIVGYNLSTKLAFSVFESNCPIK